MHTKISTALYLVALFFSSSLLAINSYADAHALHAGEWTTKKYSIKGGWKIVKEDGKHYIELDSAFKTKNAPDLKLFLSKQAIQSTNGKNATDNAVLVSELKSNKGAQRYLIPSNINVADYKTLLLHCEQYSVLWGGSTLK